MGNEINRRIQSGWKSFNEHKIVLKRNIPNSLKKKLHNQFVLPAMTYASETRTLTKALKQNLAAAQRNLERASWQDHRTNKWIRNKTKVCDIVHGIEARKWTWPSHIARLQDNRWTFQVTDWRPMDGSRLRDRLLNRWRDEVDYFCRPVTWKQNAQDRLSWKNNAEAFIQQVDW